MFIFELINHQILNLLTGDRPLLGKLRLILFIGFPLSILIIDAIQPIFGNFSEFLRKIIILYYLGFASAFVSSVAYIKNIYNQETDKLPLRHFIVCFFGIFLPKVEVSNRIKDSIWKDLVEKIGGPAYLTIAPGYAVLTETLTAPAHIYGQGKRHFISRQERVYEFIALQEQEGTISEVKATTRDGIEVTVENVKFNYRLWDRQWEDSQRSFTSATNNPFPFSEDAIYKHVYNRTVRIDNNGNEQPFSWLATARGRIYGLIANHISRRRLDDVIAPRKLNEKTNPREELRRQAYEPKFRSSLRSIGTVLMWWDPGEFKSLKEIESQFLSNWSIDLTSHIKLNTAHGDAQKQAYEELGRAEAEADLLMSIIRALDGIKFGPDKAQTLQNLILMRTAQVIKALNTPALDVQSSKTIRPKQDDDNKEAK